MKITTSTALVLLYVAVVLSLTPIGFDYYSYAIDHEPFNIHVWNKLGSLIVPRYLAASYLYSLSAYIGLPIAIVVLCLVSYPIVLFVPKAKERGSHVSLELALFIIIMLISPVYISSNLIAVLWLLSYHFTRKPPLLLGSMLSALGPLIFFLYLLTSRNLDGLLKYLLILSSFLFLNQFLTPFFFSNSSFFRIDINDLSLDLQSLYLMASIVSLKIHYLFYTLLLIGLSLLFKRQSKKAIRLSTGKFQAVIALTILVAVSTGTLLKGSHNLLFSLVRHSDNVCRTWFSGCRNISSKELLREKILSSQGRW